jgi:hypothetical protein
MSTMVDAANLAPAPEHATGSPIFIVGAQRSGTTMLRLMLNRHPQLCIPFESGFIVPFFRRLHEYGDLGTRDNARRLLGDILRYPLMAQRKPLTVDEEAVLAGPIAGYGDLVNAIFLGHARSQGKSQWGDKTPSYVEDLDALWTIFPGCRIVHLVRDGRDVALSNRRLAWGIQSLPRAASDWRWKVTLGRRVGSVLAPFYREVRYEELVAWPGPTLRGICDFLALPYEQAMLGYAETARSHMPAASLAWHENSIRPPDRSLAYAWKYKMSLSDRIIFEQVAGDTLELFGYEREWPRSTLRSRLKNLYYATVRRW